MGQGMHLLDALSQIGVVQQANNVGATNQPLSGIGPRAIDFFTLRGTSAFIRFPNGPEFVAQTV